MNKPFDFDSFMLGCIVGAAVLALSLMALQHYIPITPLDLGIPV